MRTYTLVILQQKEDELLTDKAVILMSIDCKNYTNLVYYQWLTEIKQAFCQFIVVGECCMHVHRQTFSLRWCRCNPAETFGWCESSNCESTEEAQSPYLPLLILLCPSH